MANPMSPPEHEVTSQDQENKLTAELVTLVRGFFATPLISSLSRLGVLDIVMDQETFCVEDFASIPNKKLLRESFDYLTRIGLVVTLASSDERFQVSELGKEIFRRASSFYVPHSYGAFMTCYGDRLLSRTPVPQQGVERSENVIGSGKTHRRYFPPAVSFLKRRVPFDVIVDLGCGDGHFLSTVLDNFPDKGAVGIDSSVVSLEIVEKNLRQRYHENPLLFIRSNVEEIDLWSKQLAENFDSRKLVISAWFVLHEISNKNPSRISQFLSEIHHSFPDTPLLIGEIVRQRYQTLAMHRHFTLMPEYLFFHDMSGQGVLSWPEYQAILAEIPYQLKYEKRFDEIPDEEGLKVPSAFVWCLLPK